MTAIEVYEKSDGDATRALYAQLEALGPRGYVAANLFRAQKCSARAKEYSRRYKADAYGRKQWAMGNLTKCLTEHGETLDIRWGWKRDTRQEIYPWVLYVDLPNGQVSFHTAARGVGPDYPGDWDQVPTAVAGRVVTFAQQVLDGAVQASALL